MNINKPMVKTSTCEIKNTNLFVNNAFKDAGILHLPSYEIKLTDQIIINKETQFVKIIAQPGDNFCQIDYAIRNAMKTNQMIAEISCPEEYTIAPQTDSINEMFAMNEYYLNTFVADKDQLTVKEIMSALAKKLYDIQQEKEFRRENPSERSSWWKVINPLSWMGWAWTMSKSLFNRISQKSIEMQLPEYIIIYHKQVRNRFQITTTNYLFIIAVEERPTSSISFSNQKGSYYYIRTNGYKFATFDQM